MTPAQNRAAKRLQALGIDTAAVDEVQVRAFYEQERARYLQLAGEGLHFAPTHAVYGMLVEALMEFYGWESFPDGWSLPHPEWKDS